MFKKSLLAVALCGALVGPAMAATVYDKDGTSLEVYGRVQAVYYSQDSGANVQSAANDGNLNATSRLGFNMRSELNSYAAAFAGMEWDNADDDTNDTFSARTLWVGAYFGDFGTLTAGRFEDAVYQIVESSTDVLEDWGCNGQFGNDDRRDGSLGYAWSGYGFDVMVTYNTPKDSQTVGGAYLTDGEAPIKAGYGIGIGYTTPDVLFGPIGIKAGFGGATFQDKGDVDSDYERENGNPYAENPYDRYTHYAAALTWGGDEGLYLAALYTLRSFELYSDWDGKTDALLKNDYDTYGVELVASYAFTNGVSLTASYQYLKVDEDGRDGVSVDGATIPVYVKYQVNPAFNIWAEARFDAGCDDSSTDERRNLNSITGKNFEENIFSFGARYTF